MSLGWLGIRVQLPQLQTTTPAIISGHAKAHRCISNSQPKLAGTQPGVCGLDFKVVKGRFGTQPTHLALWESAAGTRLQPDVSSTPSASVSTAAALCVVLRAPAFLSGLYPLFGPFGCLTDRGLGSTPLLQR
jgi:hypothetical protein